MLCNPFFGLFSNRLKTSMNVLLLESRVYITRNPLFSYTSTLHMASSSNPWETSHSKPALVSIGTHSLFLTVDGPQRVHGQPFLIILPGLGDTLACKADNLLSPIMEGWFVKFNPKILTQIVTVTNGLCRVPTPPDLPTPHSQDSDLQPLQTRPLRTKSSTFNGYKNRP